MKIAFIINDHKTENAKYTTPGLGYAAHQRGHQAYFIGIGELGYASEGHISARCKTIKEGKFKSQETYFAALQKEKFTKIDSEELDVLFLRNDPSEEINKRDWAQNAAYIFGGVAILDKVIVINHPNSLSGAINKMYFQHFPEILRPKTIISRDKNEIKRFFKKQGNKMILKPLQGSGGKNVFIMDKANSRNMSQVIEAICEDGYVIAQEYLEEAKGGDIRLFLMNGEPLQVDGKYAMMKRVNATDDVRNNISAGGSTQKVEMTDQVRQLAEIVRPKLLQDGMFLVGIDIVGDKLMEINVFSPGGLNTMGRMYGVDFATEVIKSIEQKVHYRSLYPKQLINSRLATL